MQVPNDYADKHVCIIGLGYVGLTLAVAMAEVGYAVIGIEKNLDVVKTIEQGRAPFHEKGLDPRLQAQVDAGRLKVSSDLSLGANCSVFIVTVGTPLVKGQKLTELSAIKSVARGITAILKEGDLVILRSTVRVGVTRDVVKPIFDEKNVAYALAFCPERTLEGKALEELRSLPQIIGGIDESSTIRAAQMFSFLTPTTIKVSSLESAEVIKLINNTQRDLYFAFANEVAHICDWVGVSATEVIHAANMGYARSNVPLPGPVGGPCLEKDPYILAEGVELRGGTLKLGLTGRALNEDLLVQTADRIKHYLAGLTHTTKAPKISILGLAFKGRPETSDLRGSMAIPLIAELQKAMPTATIVGYDPAVHQHEAEALGIKIVETAIDAFNGADVCIFQTNHPAFERLPLDTLSNLMTANGLIYDYWNQFSADQYKLSKDTKYAGLGNWINVEKPAKAYS